MIKGRALDHIGIGVLDVEATAEWYQKVLGFRVMGKFKLANNTNVYFLINGGTVYEMYQVDELPDGAIGKIDHIAYVSKDIEKDYNFCKDAGYKICTNGVESIDFWDNGVKYFKIESPSKEQIEFCQIL